MVIPNLSERDRSTPLRLLGLMSSWATDQIFKEIWGQTYGQHFWYKWRYERGEKLDMFFSELDENHQKKLWEYLTKLSESNEGEPEKDFMVFYRRNNVGIPLEYVSAQLLAITHQFICTVKACSAHKAMQLMNPFEELNNQGERVKLEMSITESEIQVGDVIIQCGRGQVEASWEIVMGNHDEFSLKELPPW